MRHIILPVLFFMTLNLFSQNNEGIRFNGKPGTMEYSFDEGLRRDRAANEFYKAEYSKNNLTDNKLYDFAKKNDLYIRRIKEKTIDRFGTKADVVIGWEFLPKKELDRFVISVMAGQNIVKSQIANIFWPVDNYLYEDRVAWTGNVVNGRADGHGTAIAQTSAGYNYAYMTGTFKNGFLQGTGEKVWVKFEGFPEQINLKETARIKIEIGEFHEGLANCSFGEKFGFIDENGAWAVQPQYLKVISDFQNGKAVVVSNDGECYINKSGAFVDWTQKQKNINAAKDAEAKRLAMEKKREEHEKELKAKREAEERQKQEILAERARVEAIRKAQPGDRIMYSQNWKWSSGMWWWERSGSYNMTITCYVEQNINNGERLQVRVGDVSSDDRERYSTPEIDGIKFSKGDVHWIKPLNNKGWHMY